ncbi:623_t:CDS:2, partial [Entrophospora sp. SA101]
GGSKEKAFKVIAGTDDDVSDLKEKIKGKRPNTFTNTDAAEIVLWKVNIPIDEDAMEVDIFLKDIQDKLKLSIPTRKICDVFTENIADASIHIIVKQPSGQGNSTDVFSLIEELNNKVESVDNKLESGFRNVDNKVESGFRNVDNKVESGFRKVQNAMDQSLYSSGIATETDKGKEVRENGTQIDFPLNVTTSTKSKTPGNKLKLIVEDTRNSPVLATRKPDFVLIPRYSHLDYLNVIAIGEIKKLTSANFSNAQIGQAVSYGEKLLQLQPQRNFVFVVLTDCITINIYKVSKVDNYQKSITQFKYEYIAPQPMEYNSSNNNGWKYLVTFMESSPSELGWIEPSLKFGSETVNLVRSAGVGRTSVVYEGKHNDEFVVVKMAKKVEYLLCFEREKDVLEKLSTLNSPYIPKILFNNYNTLVITSHGVKVNNLRKKDIKDIITTLRDVHSCGIIHRDLRKYNFLCNFDDLSENILIIDWGYSTSNSESTKFAGALECMPNEVLESLINGEEIIYGPKVDLMCFVRSFYLMIHRPSLDRSPFDKDYDIKKRAQTLLNFWSGCGKSDVWDSIYNAIEELDYDKLIQELERIF